MRFHVLGIGSIGTLISHHLRRALPSSPISLIVRSGNAFPSTVLHPRGKDGQGNVRLVVERAGKTVYNEDFETEIWQRAHPPVLTFPRRPTSASASASELPSEIPLPPESESEYGYTNSYSNDPPPNGPITSLIVCLKTCTTLEALSRLKPRLSPSSVITLLQNGMGVYDELCAALWPDPATRPFFVLGTTTHGVSPTRYRGHVKHVSAMGQGDIKWGVVSDPRAEVDLEKWIWGKSVSDYPILSPPPSPTLPLPSPPAGLSTDYSNLHETLTGLLSLSALSPSLLPMPHLHHNLLLKCALNATINPLTAIIGSGSLPNGSLIGSSPSHQLIRMLCEETSQIITTYLYDLAQPETPPADVLLLFSAENLAKRVNALCRSTASNSSSMAVDVAEGRITEIDHITGYLISMAARLGIPTPHHQMALQMVKFTAEINGLRDHLPRSERRLVEEKKTDIQHKIYDVRERDIELEEKKIELELKQRELDLKEKEMEEEQRRQEKKAALAEQRRIHRLGLKEKRRELIAMGVEVEPPLVRAGLRAPGLVAAEAPGISTHNATAQEETQRAVELLAKIREKRRVQRKRKSLRKQEAKRKAEEAGGEAQEHSQEAPAYVQEVELVKA